MGIARHVHGFVPWDDDLDIAVWAGDMPRFLAAARQLPAPLLAVKKPQEINPTIKIMDNRTRIHGAHDAPAPPNQPNGVFIDVVPIMHWRSARWKRLDDVYTRLLAVSRTPRSTVPWKRGIKGACVTAAAHPLCRRSALPQQPSRRQRPRADHPAKTRLHPRTRHHTTGDGQRLGRRIRFYGAILRSAVFAPNGRRVDEWDFGEEALKLS